MAQVRTYKNVQFSIFDTHIMASKDNRLILMEKISNFSIWKIEKKEFKGQLDIIWELSPCALPEIAWLVIEDETGKKLARTA